MPGKSKKPVYHKAVSSKRRKLGELLLQAGLIDATILEEALDLQKVQNKKIGQVLFDMGVVDHVTLGQSLADQLHLPFVRLANSTIAAAVLAKVPREIVEKYSLIPLKITGEKLVVSMADPLEHAAIDDLQFVTQMPIYLVVSPLGEILEAIDRFYPKPDIEKYLDTGIEAVDLEIVSTESDEDRKEQDLLNLADLPPVVRFTNVVIAEAISMRASDIHIEPRKDKLIIRCRIDGVMHETMKTERHIHASLISRIKVISGLDISVQRKPQDGKAQVNYGGEKFDLRIATIPTSYGEKVTIRILNPATARMTPEDLGFSDLDLVKVMDTISLPQGILLVTGPTGSGKSSTLYACLNELNKPTVNIITVEDPVESDIEGINQVQINPKAGITFAAGLRSILRQDPDIVMVGEIRDDETAAIAFQAAQTGHLVLSTLHTNDAPSAVTRLLNLKVDDFQIAAALIAVIGQRLVRRIHQECKVPDSPDPRVLRRIHAALGDDDATSFWKGAGCEHCQGSGYSGRMGLFECLAITPSLRRLITPNISADSIQIAAEKEGFQILAQDGIRKALQGLTSIDEVFRVAPPPDTSLKRVPPTVAAPPDSTDGDIRKVLIVDDNEEMLVQLRHMLESRQFTVLGAENGKKALQMAETEKPGLIITDYMMPEMDGMALIKALKARDSTRRIPTIMLTAKDDLESEVAIIDAGADDYLTKPVNRKRLLARVGRFFVQQKKILIVDDSDEVLQLLHHILRAENFFVLTAENGQEALPLIAGEKPDLIITDYYMPEMDGMTLIREVKSHEHTRRIPVIMLTAEDEVESEVEVIDAGADDYLTKPVNAKRLVSRVKRLLGKDR